MEKALPAIFAANDLADLIELRVDCMPHPKLETLLQAVKKPVIVTNRWPKEGGRFEGREKDRLAILREAAALGAPWIDVEMASKGLALRELVPNREGTRWILSKHDFRGTPSLVALPVALAALR